ISLWGLVRDFLGDVFDWDARIWRTLRPLTFRPGLLTQEFLRGRRAHYTPPFRMYLILSVVFFLIASIFDPGKDLTLDLGNGGASLTIDDNAGTKRPDSSDGERAGNAPVGTPPPAPDASVGSPEISAQEKASESIDTARDMLIERIVGRLAESA